MKNIVIVEDELEAADILDSFVSRDGSENGESTYTHKHGAEWHSLSYLLKLRD